MDELLFSVEGNKATPATPISLSDAGLRERADLQEWVLAHPEILGSGVIPLSFEFDRWRNSTGDRERDRLDVLGLADDGRLVVAELKRDRAPETVEMQAIKYAAMTSRFTAEVLAGHYAEFLTARGEATTDEDALARLEQHAGPLDLDLLRQPRIVLVAGSFPAVVTASVVWLTEMGLDIALQRVQAYRVRVADSEGVVISVSQLYPLPDVEEFTVAPLASRARAAERRAARSASRPISRLLAAGAIPDGTEVALSIPANAVPIDTRTAVEEWIREDPARGRATWVNKRPPLVWAVDGQQHRPKELALKILEHAANVTTNVTGIRWWVLPDGLDLATKASSLGGGTFDWAVLHELLAAIPEGRWTTYGDIAQVIGTAPQPVGNHMNQCRLCVNPWRVLTAGGRVASKFAWTDADDTRDPQELLEAEGVALSDGVADPARRLSLDEVRAVADE